MRDNIISMNQLGKEGERSGRNRGMIPEVQEEELKEEPTASFNENTITSGGGVKTEEKSMGGGVKAPKKKTQFDQAGVRPNIIPED